MKRKTEENATKIENLPKKQDVEVDWIAAYPFIFQLILKYLEPTDVFNCIMTKKSWAKIIRGEITFLRSGISRVAAKKTNQARFSSFLTLPKLQILRIPYYSMKSEEWKILTSLTHLRGLEILLDNSSSSIQN